MECMQKRKLTFSKFFQCTIFFSIYCVSGIGRYAKMNRTQFCPQRPHNLMGETDNYSSRGIYVKSALWHRRSH